jgi:hypothetical protein
MSAFTAEVAQRAMSELKRWNNGKGRETADPFCAYVGEYWSFGLKNAHINGRTTYQDKKGNTYRPAWSSAFISFIMKKSGAGSEFYYHEGHIHYVVKAMRDASAPQPTAKFLARDPTAYAPKVGDIINAGRGAAKSLRYGTVLNAYGGAVVPYGAFQPSHSDIVVAVSKGKVVTIGGNVEPDTVGEKTWRLRPDGTLVKGGEIITVIECLL